MKPFLLKTLPAALDRLRADTQPLWGKMSAQHMLEHLNLMFYLSQSNARVQVFVPEENWEKSRAWLHSDKPFRRNLKVPTLPDDPAPLRYPGFEVAQEKLLEEVAGFYPYFEANPGVKPVHPLMARSGSPIGSASTTSMLPTICSNSDCCHCQKRQIESQDWQFSQWLSVLFSGLLWNSKGADLRVTFT